MVDDSEGPEFLTVQEAADYIGVSAQTLRRWDSSGKLRPLRRRPSGYRYCAVRTWSLSGSRMRPCRRDAAGEAASAHLFQVAPADVERNENLREPQREAHTKVRQHFASRADPAISDPRGLQEDRRHCHAPIRHRGGRVLVIAPNVTIRKSIAEALDLASPECFWTKTRVLSNFRRGRSSPFSTAPTPTSMTAPRATSF
ncbi:MAG: MerR family DNA-binding transcriptional regulator [Candidatus Eisenbacteria bacterium]